MSEQGTTTAADMFTLYHAINSVSSQRVRIVLTEKHIKYRSQQLKLDGDQFSPSYRKINPDAFVPTLLDGCTPIYESTIISEYINARYPLPQLVPRRLLDQAKMRYVIKLVDEHLHEACTILSFASAFRDNLVSALRDNDNTAIRRPNEARRRAYMESLATDGPRSCFVHSAIETTKTVLLYIDNRLDVSENLTGPDYSLADAALAPYIARLEMLHLHEILDNVPTLYRWWRRVRVRQSTQAAIYCPMSDSDWAIFRGTTQYWRESHVQL